MPKAHRGASTGLLRSHSRTSSTSKLTANLQLTQKDQHPPKTLDKPKKNGISHDNHQGYNKGLIRVSSAQRVHSREHIQPNAPKQQRSTQHPHQPNIKPQGKAGFTISHSNDDGDEEDGEWESSESGAVTPNHDHSCSTTEADDEEAIRQIMGQQQQYLQRSATNDARPDISRVDTARQADIHAAAVTTTTTNPPSPQLPTQHQQRHDHETRAEARTPTLPPLKTTPSPQMHRPRSHYDETDGARSLSQTPSPTRPSPRTSGRRHANTRPPSTHSVRSEQPLRPHPLIRGHSFGQVLPSKPAPLEPLTVIQDSSTTSTSPTLLGDELSTSPTSSVRLSAIPSDANEPGSVASQQRRQSVSSMRSVATLPPHVHSGLRDSVFGTSDRKRTLSTVSQMRSSAAVSSLAHLPTITRPPSPQTIVFFPPVNPHANLERIHPLLPPPYSSNHLTVLIRRTPIKEAFDRVLRAKQIRC
ncbi:hypothetical protein H0H93_007940 [Arthromyces matolae]|nr:hypothetical protein H0H93_007940 [Arthromyces matolae]